MSRERIKIFVSSAVYGFEKDIRQICSTIGGYKSRNYKYEVWNNHIGTVYVPPGLSNTDACLRAVDECDFFFGIILPRYGSGITHQEFTKAIEIDKPRGFLSHVSVRFARVILAQYMYTNVKERTRNADFTFIKTSIFEDARIIDMYNEAIQDNQPMENRRWVHEFGHHDGDDLKFVETEFKNINRLKKDLDKLAELNGGQQ